MAAIDLVVMTAAQVANAKTLDDDANAAIAPRAIDAASPGNGVSLSDGASVPLTGMFVVPKRIAGDADYQRYCPALVAFLNTLPACSLDTDVIFAPAEYEPLTGADGTPLIGADGVTLDGKFS